MLRIERQAVLAANKPLHLMIKLRYSRCANVYSSRLASNPEVSHQILPFADSTSCPLHASVNGCDNAQTRTHITLLNVSHSLESETTRYPHVPQKQSAPLSLPTKSMDSEQNRQPHSTVANDSRADYLAPASRANVGVEDAFPAIQHVSLAWQTGLSWTITWIIDAMAAWRSSAAWDTSRSLRSLVRQVMG